MPQLSFFSLQIIYLLDELSQPGAPVEMGQISAWKQTMTASLAALVKNNARLTVEADFDIMCALYSLLPGVARGDDHIPRPSGAKPLATFAVCNGPDKDTFELDGCNVKFLGVGGNLIDRDNNTQIILIGEDMLDK